MGVYRDRVFPRLMDRAMRRAYHDPVRARVCSGLRGTVVEIGFGSGLNVPHLPAAVTELLAVDPMAAGPRLAAERLAATSIPVRFVGLDGSALELPDDSADSALCTWTLCSLPDPVAAVRELARVLRPGGELRFVEHGRAPEEGTARWQRRLNPIQRRIACGCQLDRDVPAVLTAGGLEVTALETYRLVPEPAVFGSTYEGVARAG